MDAGILPVKRLADAKSRLAATYDDATRLALARALLEDALALCLSFPSLNWWVVSDDPEVIERATDAGLATVQDAGEGLNAALADAIRVVSAAGAGSVTILPADVPLAWSGDLQDLLDTGATSDIVVVPARDGGTNALYLAPPDLVAPRFGEASLKAHISEAERLGVRCAILALPRLELDIDDSDDVAAFLAHPRHRESHTGKLLEAVTVS